MVKAIFNRIKDLDKSLAQARAEASQLENLSVQNVVKFTKELHVLHREQHVMDVTRRDNVFFIQEDFTVMIIHY